MLISLLFSRLSDIFQSQPFAKQSFLILLVLQVLQAIVKKFCKVGQNVLSNLPKVTNCIYKVAYYPKRHYFGSARSVCSWITTLKCTICGISFHSKTSKILFPLKTFKQLVSTRWVGKSITMSEG